MDWINLIGTLGFPIIACCACGWFIKYTTDRNREELQRLAESHKEEIQTLTTKHENESAAWVQAINNNTLVMQRLLDKLNKGDEDND